MKIMRELGQYAPNLVFISLVCGGVAGILYIGLIPLVLSSMENMQVLQYESEQNDIFLGFEVADGKVALAFFALCIGILVTRTLSQVLLVRVSVSFTTKIREKFYSQIANSPIAVLERIGSPRLMAVMTTDVARIVAGAGSAPQILVNLVTILGMLFYIWTINAPIFYFVIVFLLAGVVSYQIPIMLGFKYFAQVRRSVDTLHESFDGIISGAKELKLNRPKRDNFIENDLLAVEAAIRQADFKAHTITTAAMNYGNMISFFVIGMLVFVFVNYYQVGAPQLVAICMILLYITGPIAGVLQSMPALIQANISLDKMNNLFQEMPDENFHSDIGLVPPWKEISFKQVSFSYGGAEGFKVGPVDLVIRKGEITFIVGGNGSGKSTFSKLITQHYVPDAGEIFFDDVKIDKNNINTYRHCISSIYSDYHLFNSMYGVDLDEEKIKEEVTGLLEDLGLDQKVKFDGGKFSTIKLSDGQRRRLALLVAFIENKELYVFDEWAADQDPSFREVYYKKILPELKRNGKAVVAITHDDRYFHLADNLVRFESGVRIE